MPTPVTVAVRTTGTQTARAQLAGVQRQVGGVGSSLKRLVVGGAAIAGVSALTTGVVGLIKGSVQAEAKFSTSMRLIAAATGAPTSAIKRLNDLAIDLGAKTQFSAQDAADAMLEMGKAGVNVKTIMGGGVQGTLTLAAAGGLELGEAATIASNALNTFSLKGTDMKRVAAALAGGANASTASVESLGQALRQVGPGATNAGLSLNETVAALSAFDNAGIKGSDAGTSLKTMLTRLVPSTDRASTAMQRVGLMTKSGANAFLDAHGNFKSLASISGSLSKALSKLSDKQRTQALNAIFGSDATRAATVLMKEGSGGIRDFIKATNDQGAAQKMAKARMDGTAGALERLSGSVETAKLRIGQELAKAVTSGGNALADGLVPAVDHALDAIERLVNAAKPGVVAVIDILEDLAPSADGAGDAFDGLVNVVGTASDVLQVLADIVDAIPDPIKSIGVEAAIAALILPRLTAAAGRVGGGFTSTIAKVKQFGAELTYAETRSTRLRSAVKGLAGVGGMLALAEGSKRAGSATGDLLGIAGGIATGFAVGGPIGGAVGGLAGVMASLSSNENKARKSASAFNSEHLQMRDTLNQVSGAATRTTRALVANDLQKRGLLVSASRLGVAERDVVGAVLGEEGARKRLNKAIDDNRNKGGALATTQQNAMSDAANNLEAYIGGGAKAFKRQAAAVREANKATTTWHQALKGLPRDVRTRVKALGTDATIAQLKALKKRFDLTPKQLRTVIKALGVDASVRQIQRYVGQVKHGSDDATRAARKGAKDTNDELGKVGRQKPNLAPYLRSLKSGVGDAKSTALLGGRQMGENLHDGPSRAKPDLGLFRGSLLSQIGGLRSSASTGGSGVGSALGSGVASGVRSWIDNVASAARSMVQQAIDAARAQAKAHSPSRETQRLGHDLGDGLAKGMSERRRKNERESSRLMRSIIKAASQGMSDLKSLLRDRLDKLKPDETRRAMKRLANESKRLETVAARQRKVNAALTEARQALQELRQTSKDYAASVKSSLESYAAVTGLDSAFNATSIEKALKARLGKLQQFSALITQLKAGGLNQATLDQLIQGGVEGGLAYAQAIATGGADAVASINDLQAQIAAVAGDVGQTAADNLYAAGISAAEGLVQGLEDRSDALAKVMRRLARQLVRELKDELGIKSPSRVFANLGGMTVEGLKIGVEAGNGRKIGETLARDLTTGFAQPDLTARAAFDAQVASGGAIGAGGGVVRVELTAQQMSALQRGQVLALDLNAFLAAGGKLVSLSA